MDERIISGEACIAEGADWLSARDPKLARAYAITGPLPLRLRPDGFSQLLSAIVSQQVSVASANAIWAKMEAAGCIEADAIRAQSEERLREIGLSRQKAAYAKALAQAELDYEALRQMPSEAVIKELIEVKGIGVWTAEIYAMFGLGRADVFAPGDLALQEAARAIYDLPERPTEKVLRAMAQDWSPWRSVAARLLFAYYKHHKSREGIR